MRSICLTSLVVYILWGLICSGLAMYNLYLACPDINECPPEAGAPMAQRDPVVITSEKKLEVNSKKGYS